MKDKRRRNTAKKKKMSVSSFTIQKQNTLLSCLISTFPDKTRKLLKAVLRDRQISVDGRVVTQFDQALTPGQLVEISWEKVVVPEEHQGLDIVHLDQDIIIINKPSGLLTVATDKEKRKTAYSILSNYVKAEGRDNKIFIIHRIDRETSGLLMFARSEAVKHQIQKTWTTTINQRTYVGLVEGEVGSPDGTITSWLTESKAFIVYSSQNRQHGKKSTTHYKKIKANSTFSLLQIKLDTGRKHQIRVHMQDMGHPVVGDKKYGSVSNPIGRMGLHARILAFTHPRTGKSCHFDTGIPRAFLRPFAP